MLALRLPIAWWHISDAGWPVFLRAIVEHASQLVHRDADEERGDAAEAPLATPPSDQVSSLQRRPNGRTEHFQDLFLPHLDAAYNLARFLSRDADAAQDIVQDAYLRAFKAFDGFRGGEPRAWILAIVRNCCRAWMSRRRHERANLSEISPEDDPEWGFGADKLGEIPDIAGETPEWALARQREIDAVRHVIEMLPEPFREVLILRELEEFQYSQIAEIVEVPIGTVMSRLARARRLFGAAWLRHYGTSELAN